MKVAIVSTYPPRPCGIGVFASDLRRAILQADASTTVDIVSIVGDEIRAASATAPAAIQPNGEAHHQGQASPGARTLTAITRPAVRRAVREHPHEVLTTLQQHVRADYAAVARRVAAAAPDVVLLEHEFGIFGGEAGDFVLSLVNELQQPLVVTLHTVLSAPTPHQAATLRALCRRASLVTVFTETARRMVTEAGIVAPERIRVVPHGAPSLLRPGQRPAASASRNAMLRPIALLERLVTSRLPMHRFDGRTVLSTFGLISSGKGIEYAIQALPAVVEKHPEVLYLVAGQTHPEVVRHEGERYRDRLEQLVHELNLEDHVQFIDKFLTDEELAELLSATDLYLTPYRSREQIVSGALTFAVAAGCPVVSTPYFYAEDLLSTGAGVLVPFADPAAMAAAVLELLDCPEKLAAARAEATRIGADLSWPNVGKATLRVVAEAMERGAPRDAAELPAEPGDTLNVRLDHLWTLVDDVGIIQHADGVVPNRETGYCVDDAARLALVALGLGGKLPDERVHRLLSSSLAFLRHAWDPAVPGMRNFMSYDRLWQDLPHAGDHVGRTAWALGEVVAEQPSSGAARPSLRQLEAMVPSLLAATSVRTVAYAVLGLSRPALELLPAPLQAALRTLTNRLSDSFDQQQDPRWRWFEPVLTYDNARLPQALLAAGRRFGDRDLIQNGLAALDWYVDQCMPGNATLRLVGNRWRQRDDAAVPAAGEGDEQPLDAAALVEALVEAWAASGSPTYGQQAVTVFEWFLGANTHGIALYDSATGGCHDGLGPRGLNDNEGAESTLAFWQALLALDNAGLQAFSLQT